MAKYIKSFFKNLSIFDLPLLTIMLVEGMIPFGVISIFFNYNGAPDIANAILGLPFAISTIVMVASIVKAIRNDIFVK